jgi:hypothetical protein
MFKKTIAATALTVAFMFVPVAANALHCNNVSRPPAECGANCPEPVFNGNWAWLPSVFGPEAPQTWVFVPPGSLQELDPTAPIGQKGNFQNGTSDALLLNSVCDSEQALSSRQNEHGIQLLGPC